ncbi:KH domain-containing protein [Geobacillus stearothermophilus]|uniref:KH domain-containing protein n=1 Tax=Geobacillus stearothermophilus TaxID=1422 RepID=UPI002E1DBB4E|nr:KH domain-containing protein [Geobacillus stearothermophilus]MED3844038.1 KH domain-containing protein [Geobacillus stearothermophilus]MED4357122.1 KH domain-containing protein [Geobacillus stearothermophilus]
MKPLIETIVKALVDHPEAVAVETREEETAVIYELSVHDDDIGKVIGKQGRTIHAIRTVVYAAAGSPKRVIVHVKEKG